MAEQKGRVESVLEFRGSFVEIIVVAVAIGLSISLFADALAQKLGQIWSVAVGTTLSGLAIFILIARVVPKINRQLSLEGVLVIGPQGRPVTIDRYVFSRELSDSFRALFLENKALEKTWLKQKGAFQVDAAAKKTSKEAVMEMQANKRLVREGVEYFVLDCLSLELSGYFNRNPEIDEKAIVTLERNDIPSVLLSNRFLDLLSRPMEEREVFSNFSRGETQDEPDREMKLVAAFTGEGAIFDRFELVLPRGSTVSRGSDHSLLIDTKRFSLRFEVKFDGYGAVLPFKFEESYLGTKFDKTASYKVDIVVDVKFKWATILSRSGWQYFRWIDLFIRELERRFSFELFLDHVGWETARTMMLVNKQMRQPRR
ncbi:MAG: hypothetical protein AB7O50_03535 [Pseudolabrys sp.]